MGAWQSPAARGGLSDIIDPAVAGNPQFIQRRDGKEVVVVSRDYFWRTKANLKTVLLNEGYEGAGEDAFDYPRNVHQAGRAAPARARTWCSRRTDARLSCRTMPAISSRGRCVPFAVARAGTILRKGEGDGREKLHRDRRTV